MGTFGQKWPKKMALRVAKSKLECLICNIFHSRLNSANALNISNFGKNIKHKKMSGSKMSVIITAENMLFMDKFTLVANDLHCRRQWQISPLLLGLWKGTLACLFLTLFKWAKKCTNHPGAGPHKTRNRPSGQTRPNSWAKQVREIERGHWIYEMKNGKEKVWRS